MTLRTWTVYEVVSAGACYEPERVVHLWAGRARLSYLEIMALDIPAPDRLWVVWQDGELAPLVIERIVTRAVTTHALACGDPVVEAWARRWLSGEDRTEAAARAAAWAAAWAAARAAREAAGAAARAAGAAECDLQVADVLAVVADQEAR